jgi:hypothetical protein
MNSLGDGADLAVVLGQQCDDAVGLAQFVGTEHHGVVPVGPGSKGLLDHG